MFMKVVFFCLHVLLYVSLLAIFVILLKKDAFSEFKIDLRWRVSTQNYTILLNSLSKECFNFKKLVSNAGRNVK